MTLVARTSRRRLSCLPKLCLRRHKEVLQSIKKPTLALRGMQVLVHLKIPIFFSTEKLNVIRLLTPAVNELGLDLPTKCINFTPL